MTGAPLAAEEGGSMAPNLNPFSYKRQRKAPTSARVTDKGGGWKLPQLWPIKGNKSAAQARQPAQPTAWQKWNAGTKNFLAETADTLNPFNDANDNEPPATITGSGSMFRQASKKPETKSKSFLPSWLGGEEEPEEPKTVSDFLMQPKPGF
jgi:hypothetical protein